LPEDECLFFADYTARKGWAHSATNQMILNYKMPVKLRGTARWPHKQRAIQTVADLFSARIGARFSEPRRVCRRLQLLSRVEPHEQDDEGLTAQQPKWIGIVDDLLVTGCRFRAMSNVLRRRFPDARIIGLFIARRVPDAIDFSDFFDQIDD
jgi:hypothetical protein